MCDEAEGLYGVATNASEDVDAGAMDGAVTCKHDSDEVVGVRVLGVSVMPLVLGQVSVVVLEECGGMRE